MAILQWGVLALTSDPRFWEEGSLALAGDGGRGLSPARNLHPAASVRCIQTLAPSVHARGGDRGCEGRPGEGIFHDFWDGLTGRFFAEEAG